MSSTIDRTKLLNRWRALLTQLGHQPTARGSDSGCYNVLYAKVLRYLVARYDDEACWNKYALRLPPAAKLSAARASGGRASAVLTTPVASPPRASQEMLPKLQSIHAANVESYREFDLRGQ